MLYAIRRQSNRGSTVGWEGVRRVLGGAACVIEARGVGGMLPGVRGVPQSGVRTPGRGATAGAIRPAPGYFMGTMAYQHIQVGLQDGVLTVVLDRPDVLNSFNARMADDVAAA